MAIVDSYSESSYLADQVLADIPPCWMLISQIPALTVHISFLLWELIFGWPNVGRSTPIKWLSNRLLLWQPIFHSYCESSYLSDQVLAGLPPIKWQFHRLLLWHLIFHSYSKSSYLAVQVFSDLPPHQTSISQIPALTTHISFLLWELILGRPGVGRSTPTSNINFTDSCSDNPYFIPTLRTHIWQTKCWQI